MNIAAAALALDTDRPVSEARLWLCPGCDLAVAVPALEPGAMARCTRCGTVLRYPTRRPLAFAALGTAASPLLLGIGATQTLAVVSRLGQERTADLFTGPIALAKHGLWILSVLVVITTLIMPLVVDGLLAAVLVGIHRSRGAPWIARAFIWRNRLRLWAMIDVFLIGYFVAYSKLGALAHVEPGPGIWALAAYMAVNVAIDAVVDPQSVWEAIGPMEPAPAEAAGVASEPSPRGVCCPECQLACEGDGRCPRCGKALERRKPISIVSTAALGFAGLIFYIPANVLPVLSVKQLGSGSPSTILGGVHELLNGGQWPLAAIVFLASVAVPVMKILGLSVMLWAAARGPATRLHGLSVLYRIVLAIGRWSMIDIFMESILSALVQFGTIAEVDPEPGAVAFAAVVVLTMLAAERFDPRLMWDKAAA